MEKVIFINQKMYLNTKDEIQKFQKTLKDYKEKFVVIPSTIYIDNYISNNFIVGSQIISDEIDYNHTGDVSAQSLKDMGVKYVIIGHAETREKYPNLNIKRQIKNALDNNLKVILCIGEINEDDIKIIDKQLEGIIPSDDIIISYEPVWAIGTNRTPSNDKISIIASHIKRKGHKKVMYGGSVKEDNIEKLNEIKNIDGFLIGSASLNPKSIIKMIEVVS